MAKWNEEHGVRHKAGRPPSYAAGRNGGGNELAGDFIIWMQLIEFARERSDGKPIVLVTQDRKPVGWIQHQGSIPIGANERLVDELREKAGVRFVVIGPHHLQQFMRLRESLPRPRESAWLEEAADGPFGGVTPLRSNLINDVED